MKDVVVTPDGLNEHNRLTKIAALKRRIDNMHQRRVRHYFNEERRIALLQEELKKLGGDPVILTLPVLDDPGMVDFYAIHGA